MKSLVLACLGLGAGLGWTSVAHAGGYDPDLDDGGAARGAAQAAAMQPPPPMPDPGTARPSAGPPEVGDQLRFRHGFAFNLGEEIGSGPSSGLTGVLGGIDWRLGAQINNQYAVYLDNHLSFGTAHIGKASGVTGNLCETVMVERTFADHYAIAAGAGYGVLNNPSGPAAHARAVWYPFVHASGANGRRRGLMVGADLRAYFAGDAIGTVTQVSLALGYEKF